MMLFSFIRVGENLLGFVISSWHLVSFSSEKTRKFLMKIKKNLYSCTNQIKPNIKTPSPI